MSWTVACFCGSVYAAPPNRCAVCGSSIDDAVSGDARSSRLENAGDLPRAERTAVSAVYTTHDE